MHTMHVQKMKQISREAPVALNQRMSTHDILCYILQPETCRQGLSIDIHRFLFRKKETTLAGRFLGQIQVEDDSECGLDLADWSLTLKTNISLLSMARVL